MKRALSIVLPDGWSGEVVDLSATGMRVRTLAIVPRGAELRATLQLPDGDRMELSGTVMWFTPPDHARGVHAEFGLQLVDVPDEYFTALVRFFAEES